MIKLKEGQKIIDKDGNMYLIEKGDCLVESTLKEDKQTAIQIRDFLKKNGYNIRDFSIKASYGGYSSSVDIYIKNPKIDKKEINDLVKKFQNVDYDARSGEVLMGGNTYIFVHDVDGTI